jgi:hypothetical protein
MARHDLMRAALLAGAIAALGGCGDATRDDEDRYEGMGSQEFPDPNRETDGFGPPGDTGSFTEQRLREQNVPEEEIDEIVGETSEPVREQR